MDYCYQNERGIDYPDILRYTGLQTEQPATCDQRMNSPIVDAWYKKFLPQFNPVEQTNNNGWFLVWLEVLC